jgi:5-formyltetrahydrofolate cyclo-ligase
MSIQKDEFRKKCIKKAKKKLPNKLYLDTKVNNKLKKVLQTLPKNSNVLFYIPLPFEADITKVLKKFRKKLNIFVPFMVGKSFKMVSYRLPLKKKKFGIYEAGNSYKIIKNLDLAIVPIVGIDKDFKRVGFGKGMYDRFFDSLDKKPYIIFVQLKLCKTSKSVCDSYDIQGDMLITSEVWLEKRR